MFSPPELVGIVVVLLVLFGGSQLPKLAKNLGRAQKEFKEGLADGAKGDSSDKADTTASSDKAETTPSSDSAS